MNNSNDFYLADAIGVIDEILASGGEFRLYPKGTSMRPLLIQGEDSVVLKRRNGVPAKKHDIAFYRRRNGQFVLHRVMKVAKDGTYTMCGDNQFVLERGVPPESVIGYVDRIYKGDKPIADNSAKYAMYVFWWTKLPFRRCVRYTESLWRAVKYKLGIKKD